MAVNEEPEVIVEEVCPEEVVNETPMRETAEEPYIVPVKSIKTFEKFLKMLKQYGPFRMIFGAMFMVFFSLMIYLTVNPNVIFEKYDSYVEQIHKESNNYRMEGSPIIRSYLNQLSSEAQSNGAFVIEYHNGKHNPSGLQWQYGDMTFLSDNADDISSEFQDISLAKYPLFFELYQNGIWTGSRDELMEFDKRFALKMEVNDETHIGMVTMYGANLVEVGVLGVVYSTDSLCISDTAIKKALRKYANSITPLLDGRNAKKK